MDRRPVDMSGAVMLTSFAILLAFNQIVIKVTSDGISPFLQAGLRSAGAAGVILIWAMVRKKSLVFRRDIALWGVLLGAVFAFEFACLFTSLSLTTVSRASVIFYSMPIWLALVAHFILPNEQLTPKRVVGLVIAMSGIVLAFSGRTSAGDSSLLGDVLALCAAFGWGTIALLVRIAPIARENAETQLFYQLSISAPILLVFAFLSPDRFFDPTPLHLWGMVFQIVCVAGLGFLGWFWLMKRYSASGVASFSFLSPVLSVVLAWLILGERVNFAVWGALVLVCCGVALVNRK